jgi:hypothetical protein
MHDNGICDTHFIDRNCDVLPIVEYNILKGLRTDSKLRYVSFLFYKNLLWEIVSDAFGPNWDCKKESFPTFIVNLSFTYE